jgi:hypothetical protein
MKSYQTIDKVYFPDAGMRITDPGSETLMMEETKSFFDLAEKVEPFEPDYTEEFVEYMKESVRQSRKMAAEALESARDIVIF